MGSSQVPQEDGMQGRSRGFGGREAGRNQMGTLAIYGSYLVTRLLSCTACYIFVNDTPALSALPACTSFRWRRPWRPEDTSRYVGL